MTKTVNYNLNKPETADPLRMADFNENADIIDGLLAGCTRIVTGGYVGTGAYGGYADGVCCQIAFTGSPKFIIVGGAAAYLLFLMPGLTAGIGISALPTPVNTVGVTWQENRVLWWSTAGAAQQLNQSNQTYSYLLIY